MAELVELEILTTVVTSRYGSLSRGDLLRTDKDYAEHLIEVHAAKYVTAPAVAPTPRSEAPPAVAEEPAEPARRTLFAKKRK
jgi:hypothetical protein